jgi:hypothetical protein
LIENELQTSRMCGLSAARHGHLVCVNLQCALASLSTDQDAHGRMTSNSESLIRLAGIGLGPKIPKDFSNKAWRAVCPPHAPQQQSNLHVFPPRCTPREWPCSSCSSAILAPTRRLSGSLLRGESRSAGKLRTQSLLVFPTTPPAYRSTWQVEFKQQFSRPKHCSRS